MRAGTWLVLSTCAWLVACSMASDLHSDKATALVGHPLFTTSEAFVVDQDPTFLHPKVTAMLHFIGPGQPRSGWIGDCLPRSIAEYQTNLHHWEEHARLACGGEKLIPLPIGTALQIDVLDESWDPENGTQYRITARLLDTTLTGHEIELLPGYFVRPRDDSPWRLDPAYFSAQPPATP